MSVYFVEGRRVRREERKLSLSIQLAGGFSCAWESHSGGAYRARLAWTLFDVCLYLVVLGNLD